MEYKSREDYDKFFWYNTKENCVFCKEKISTTNKILYETDFWIIIYAKYPYFEESIHLLVLPKRHSEFTVDLKKEELADFLEVEKYIKVFFWDKDYFSLIRQSRSNKSIEHLHYHYISWIPSSRKIEGENYFKIKS